MSIAEGRLRRGMLRPAVARLLAQALPVGPSTPLTVRGRVSDRPRTVPTALLGEGGQRWLAAVFGEIDRVRILQTAQEGVPSRDPTGKQSSPRSRIRRRPAGSLRLRWRPIRPRK